MEDPTQEYNFDSKQPDPEAYVKVQDQTRAHHSQAPPSSSAVVDEENLFTPFDVNQFHTDIIEHIKTEKNASFCKYQCNSIDALIDKLAFIGANALSWTSILYFALSTQDDSLPSGWSRWVVFATASGLSNYLQMFVVQKESIVRYLTYIKNFLQALWNGRHGIEELLGIAELANTRKKITAGVSNILRFILTEGAKWTILNFISALPSSLAKEVSWLNNDLFIKWLQVAVFFMLEPSVHERLLNINYMIPSITDYAMTNDEIKKLRHTFTRILWQNCHDAQDINEPAEHFLECEINQFLPRILNFSRKNKIFDSKRDLYLETALTIIFTTCYLGSNAGNYRATFENTADPIEYRLASIFGDSGFGFFMALRAANNLVFALDHRVGIFFRHEWRKIVISIISTGIAALTIGSTIAVSKHEHISFFVGTILTIIGTIFDNATFSTEIAIELETKQAFKSAPSNRQQRAIVAYTYEHLIKKLDQLPDCQFINYMQAVCHKHADPEELFNGYTTYFNRQLPWTKYLPTFEIVDTLYKQPVEAMQAINRSGKFGLKQKMLDGSATLMAMTMAALSFIPLSDFTFQIFSQYIFPVAAVPTGLAVIGLFHCCSDESRQGLNEHRALLNSEEQSEPSQIPDEIPRSEHWVIRGSTYIFAIAVPLGLKYLAEQLIAYWIMQNIFDLDSASAHEYSKYIGNGVATASSGLITHQLAFGMRR